MQELKDIIEKMIKQSNSERTYKDYWKGAYCLEPSEDKAWHKGTQMGYIYALKELLYKMEGKEFNPEKDAWGE